jgi:hypothetical protein
VSIDTFRFGTKRVSVHTGGFWGGFEGTKCIDFVALRARACVLRRRNEKKAGQQEKHRLLYTIIIMLS